MKKVLIIYKIFSDNDAVKGVHRKMLEQARSLERLGAQVDMIDLHSKGIRRDGKLIHLTNLQSSFSKDSYTLFNFYDDIKKLEQIYTYDVYYIRYSPSTLGMLSFLKNIKSHNANAKIYLELPTYPFIQEYSGIKKMILQLLVSKQKKLKNYVDKIVTVSNHSEIWGIPTVNIKNAIDTESYKLRTQVQVNQVIRLVMVCTYHKWHGIDRLLKGMMAYLQQPNRQYNVYLTLVGEGPESTKIHEITDHSILKDHVFYYPSTYGGELNQHFDQADLAVGALAIDRINLSDCSALKHREYGARGIPFVYAGSDASFDNEDFILNLPLKEAAVDFSAIISFFEKINKNPQNYTPKAIRSKVSEDLSWESQIGFILK